MNPRSRRRLPTPSAAGARQIRRATSGRSSIDPEPSASPEAIPAVFVQPAKHLNGELSLLPRETTYLSANRVSPLRSPATFEHMALHTPALCFNDMSRNRTGGRHSRCLRSGGALTDTLKATSRRVVAASHYVVAEEAADEWVSGERYSRLLARCCLARTCRHRRATRSS